MINRIAQRSQQIPYRASNTGIVIDHTNFAVISISL